MLQFYPFRISTTENLWFSVKIWRFNHGRHPGRLTWNLKISQLKRKIIFQTISFRFHVNLPGCKLHKLPATCPRFPPQNHRTSKMRCAWRTEITGVFRTLEKEIWPTKKMAIRMFPKIMDPQIIHSKIGFSIINHTFWGTPIFGNTYMSFWNVPHKLQPSLGKQTIHESYKMLHLVIWMTWISIAGGYPILPLHFASFAKVPS